MNQDYDFIYKGAGDKGEWRGDREEGEQLRSTVN